jgi:hypothetical protein
MPDVALYYPWTRVRDGTWLKAAALYWPRLAVLALPATREKVSPPPPASCATSWDSCWTPTPPVEHTTSPKNSSR